MSEVRLDDGEKDDLFLEELRRNYPLYIVAKVVNSSQADLIN